MKDELEDKKENHRSLAHEYWCKLLSTIKVKENRKMAATQIKSLVTSRASCNPDCDELVRLPRKKRVRTGVTPNHKR